MPGASFSLTEHYQFLTSCLIAFKGLTNTSSLRQTLNAFHEICSIGVILENDSNPYILRDNVKKMEMLSQKLGIKTSVPSLLETQAGKTRDYYLPKITNRTELIMACFYLKHLQNYQKVSYQGNVTTWYAINVRAEVDRGVASNKPWVKAQAALFESQIASYCANNGINFDKITNTLRLADSHALVSQLFTVTSLSNDLDNKVALSETNKPLHIDEVTKIYLDAKHKHRKYHLAFCAFKKIDKQLERLEKKIKAKGFVMSFSFLFSKQVSDVKKARKKSLDKLNRLMPFVDPKEYLDELHTNLINAFNDYDKALPNHYFSLEVEKKKLSIEGLTEKKVKKHTPASLESSMPSTHHYSKSNACFFKEEDRAKGSAQDMPSNSSLLLAGTVIGVGICYAYSS